MTNKYVELAWNIFGMVSAVAASVLTILLCLSLHFIGK
jgi:hypothetical protein